MRLTLAFAYPAEVLEHLKAEERARVWGVIDAVSVNILAPKAAALVADARRAQPGITVRTHSYTGWLYAMPGERGIQAPRPDLQGSAGTTLRDATDRGRKDAIAACQMQAEAHEANHEAGMARGAVRERNADGRPTKWFARADAAQLRDAWIDGWESGIEQWLMVNSFEAAPPVLHDLAFLDLATYYPDPPALSERWKSACIARDVMGYGTTDDRGEARNLAYYTSLLNKAEKLSPLPIHLWPGVGRVAGPGNVVGSDEALRALVKQNRPRLAEVCGYVGHNAWKQLITGNPEFPPIAELWPELRRLHSVGAA